jgi:hypothetical protein
VESKRRVPPNDLRVCSRRPEAWEEHHKTIQCFAKQGNGDGRKGRSML